MFSSEGSKRGSKVEMTGTWDETWVMLRRKEREAKESPAVKGFGVSKLRVGVESKMGRECGDQRRLSDEQELLSCAIESAGSE